MRTLFGRRAFVLIATGLALAACSSSGGTTARQASAPGVARPAAPTTTVARSASYAVGTREESYVDSSRPTPRNRAYAGASDRTLRVRYFYPIDGRDATAAPKPGASPSHDRAPFPVILFSHGFTGTPESYSRLLADFARHGYVVVAPAYPLSNGAAPGQPTLADLPNQPKDASFVLDQALKAGWLRGVVDPNRIGAGGHSLGGLTTYGLVFNACCRDPRIKAGLVLSGVAAGFPPAQYFEGIDTPLLAIHGDHDETVNYRGGRKAWEVAHAPKYFVTLLGGTHVSDERGGDSPGQRVLTAAALDFFDGYVRGDRRALDELRTVGATPGIATIDAQV